MIFPYGIADFRRIRREGRVYVDRTAYIRDVEQRGDILIFLRPRRFGKSLWAQTLATYYDLRFAENFDEIFDGLDIGKDPTPLANRYFILQWNFSLITPRGDANAIAQDLRDHVAAQVKAFLSDYEEYIPSPVDIDGNPQNILISLLSAIRKTPYKLYLIIDEYDNFLNEIMVQSVATYKALLEADGPFKELFKAVKNATEGLGLEKIFVTGVSPLALNDLTSGFNTATDISREPEFAGLCGFYEEEIQDLLRPILQKHGLSNAAGDQFLNQMRTWYNGYRFNHRGEHRLVYNPTNALYFLRDLYAHGSPPEALYDNNLRTDQAKLVFLAKTAAGAGVVEELTEGTGEIQVLQLLNSFSLVDLTTKLAQDTDTVASFLYYLGLLTLTDVRGRLRVPNLVVRRLLLDRLLAVFLPDLGETSDARKTALRFFNDGDLLPLLTFFETKLLPVLSNRDRGAPPQKPGQSGGGVNEMVLKAILLSILFDDQRFVLHSELEVDKGYVDLCLLVRSENDYPNAFDIIFELKLVRRKKLGKKGSELRSMDEPTLRKLPAVRTALDKARAQLVRYREALIRQRGESVRPRCYSVVAVGLERLVGEEVSS